MYKRQDMVGEQHQGSCGKVWMNPPCRIGEDPVSYTHLDVYKRQVHIVLSHSFIPSLKIILLTVLYRGQACLTASGSREF